MGFPDVDAFVPPVATPMTRIGYTTLKKVQGGRQENVCNPPNLGSPPRRQYTKKSPDVSGGNSTKESAGSPEGDHHGEKFWLRLPVL